MKIAFAKIGSEPLNISHEYEGISFNGTLKRKNAEQVLATGELNGVLRHFCDSCGQALEIDVNESLELCLNDGATSAQELDIVEFYDGFIDLDELINSEIESIKSDYFYCKNCKTN